MDYREVKVWNEMWNMDATEYVRSIDGVDLHDGHVEMVKQDLYSYISDASKDANGFRMRLNVQEHTIAELEEIAASVERDVVESIKQDEEDHHRAIVRFEARIIDLIACGAGDRATAVRWLRDAQDDAWQDDDSMCYRHGLPYTYCIETGMMNKYEVAA